MDVEIGGGKALGCLSARSKEHQPLVKLVLAARPLTSMLEADVVGLQHRPGIHIVVQVISTADLINQHDHSVEMATVEAAQHMQAAQVSAATVAGKINPNSVVSMETSQAAVDQVPAEQDVQVAAA